MATMTRPPSSAAPTVTAPSRRPRRSRQARAGYLMIAPAYLFFVAFVLGPLLTVFWLALTRYNLLTSPEFVGLDNFARMGSDGRLHVVFRNTLIYVVAAVVLMNAFGLLLAVLLNRRMNPRVRTALRSAYFFPSLVALVYVSIIWQFLLQYDVGVVNHYLTEGGGPRLNWLGGYPLGLVSVIAVDVWRNTGFAMLIYLAALQDVPSERLEAAAVDGAAGWRRFWHVSLPVISPAVLFNVFLTNIGAWQIFESIVVLTGGGPGDATRSITMYLYERAFQSFEMGYASAIAVVLFAVMLLATAALLGTQRRWVHYE